MTKYVIYNKTDGSFFGIGMKNGVKKHGFFKKGEGNQALLFDELTSANFITQILYDLRGYKSLVVGDVKVD